MPQTSSLPLVEVAESTQLFDKPFTPEEVRELLRYAKELVERREPVS
jgi:hypothetical protein